MNDAAGPVPQVPFILIEPAARRPLVDLRELWRHRELIYFLAWRDIKVRYRQTLFGVAWILLQPLAALAVFVFIFGRIPKIAAAPVPYALFVFSGLWAWTFFSSAVTTSATSLVSNGTLLKRVYFPRLALPLAAVAGRLPDLVVGLPVLAILLAYHGVALSASILLLPFALLLLVLAATAAGIWICATTVRYRDLTQALPFALQIGLFATPVLYGLDLVGPRGRAILSLNPMAGVVEAIRATVLPVPADGRLVALAVVEVAALLIFGLRTFRDRERLFADVV